MISRVFVVVIAVSVGLVLFIGSLLRPLPVGERNDRRLRLRRLFRISLLVILLSGGACAIIALTHNPDVFPTVPQAVPLLLAAHTHGGQVNIPLVGTPIVPSRFGSQYTAGHIFENGHHMYVTTGIGTSIMRVRFRVPPEIMILTVKSK